MYTSASDQPIIARFPMWSALGLALAIIGACWIVWNLAKTPPPRILTAQNTETQYFQTTNGDGGTCVTFTPTLTIQEKRNPYTDASARKLVEAQHGKPVEKLASTFFDDGCPARANFRVKFYTNVPGAPH